MKDLWIVAVIVVLGICSTKVFYNIGYDEGHLDGYSKAWCEVSKLLEKLEDI